MMARTLFKSTPQNEQAPTMYSTATPTPEVKTVAVETTSTTKQVRRPVTLQHFNKLIWVLVTMMVVGIGVAAATGKPVLGVDVASGFRIDNLTYLQVQANLKLGRYHAAAELAKTLPVAKTKEPTEAESLYDQTREALVYKLIEAKDFNEAFVLAQQVPSVLSLVFSKQVESESLEAALVNLNQLPPSLNSEKEAALVTQSTSTLARPADQLKLAKLLSSPPMRVEVYVKAHAYPQALAEVKNIPASGQALYLRQIFTNTVGTPFQAQVLEAFQRLATPEADIQLYRGALQTKQTALADEAFARLLKAQTTTKAPPGQSPLANLALQVNVNQSYPQQALAITDNILDPNERALVLAQLGKNAINMNNGHFAQQVIDRLQRLNTPTATELASSLLTTLKQDPRRP